MSSRRLARQAAVAPVLAPSEDLNRVVQRVHLSPRGEVRAWFRGGICRRVRMPDGRMYGFAEAPSVWAAILDGSFRPSDFGKHYQ